MLVFVLIANTILGVGCLLAARRLWGLSRKLSHYADVLIAAERSVHKVLYPAPGFISKGQTATSKLRQNIDRLEPQVQRVQQLMGLLNMGQFLWRRGGVGKRLRRGRGRVKG